MFHRRPISLMGCLFPNGEPLSPIDLPKHHTTTPPPLQPLPPQPPRCQSQESKPSSLICTWNVSHLFKEGPKHQPRGSGLGMWPGKSCRLIFPPFVLLSSFGKSDIWGGGVEMGGGLPKSFQAMMIVSTGKNSWPYVRSDGTWTGCEREATGKHPGPSGGDGKRQETTSNDEARLDVERPGTFKIATGELQRSKLQTPSILPLMKFGSRQEGIGRPGPPMDHQLT